MEHHREFTDRCSYINAHTWQHGVSKTAFYPSHPYFYQPYYARKNNTDSSVNGLTIIQHDPQLYATKNLFESLRKEGFIRHYGEGPMFNDYPKFHYVGINFTIDPETVNETQLGWGYCLPGGDVELAFSKALGECLERQASYYIPNITYTRFPKIKRGDASWLYTYIPHFTSSQRTQNQRIVQSVDDLKQSFGFKAVSLTGDRRRFFPFETFYWGSVINPEQKISFHHTTSGSGGGLTKEQALVSGWNELIERDHLLLYWFSGVAPQKINHESLPQNLKAYVNSMTTRYKLEVYFLDLSYDINLTVGACVIIDPVLHRIAMGAKAGFSGESVLEASLLEALAVLSSTRSRDRAVPESELKTILEKRPFSQIISRSDRVNLYASAYGNDLIRKSFLSGTKINFPSFCKNIAVDATDYRAQLHYLKVQFKNMIASHGPGYHAYAHEYASLWLDRLRYHAAHVYIPSLLKLHLNETLATPISDRLTRFAAARGIKDFNETKVNPLPHFFP